MMALVLATFGGFVCGFLTCWVWTESGLSSNKCFYCKYAVKNDTSYSECYYMPPTACNEKTHKNNAVRPMVHSLEQSCSKFKKNKRKLFGL